MLKEPLVNFGQSIVDEAVRSNADFQYKAGLSPKIVRTSTGNCCEWCDKPVSYTHLIAVEYGDENSPYAKTYMCTDLSISKALRLLQVPETEVESFAEKRCE